MQPAVADDVPGSAAATAAITATSTAAITATASITVGPHGELELVAMDPVDIGLPKEIGDGFGRGPMLGPRHPGLELVDAGVHRGHQIIEMVDVRSLEGHAVRVDHLGRAFAEPTIVGACHLRLPSIRPDARSSLPPGAVGLAGEGTPVVDGRTTTT